MEFIGIIGAMEEEVLALKEMMTVEEVRSIASLDFYIGYLKERKIVVVRAGIGKVNAAVCTQILVDVFYVDAIINTGVAGGLHHELSIGDIIISTDTMEHDFDATGFGYDIGVIPRMDVSAFKSDEHLVKIAKQASDVLPSDVAVYEGRIVSGDQFIADKAKKSWLTDTFGAYCTEMEGAAIAHVCHLNHMPCVIIRAISDNADDSADMNFAEFSKMAAKNSCHMIERILELL